MSGIKLLHNEFGWSVPVWFPKVIEEWIRYACNGMPGDFFRGLIECDLVTVIGRSDYISQETLFGMFKMIYNRIPSNVWGSKEKVQKWIDAEQDDRDLLWHDWITSEDWEVAWSMYNFEEIEIGIPDKDLHGAYTRFVAMDVTLNALVAVLKPEQFTEAIEKIAAAVRDGGPAEAGIEIVRRFAQKMEVETDGN